MKTVFVDGYSATIPDIGDKIFRSVYAKGHEFQPVKFEGTVIYVHPKFRFYTLEFVSQNRIYRESYLTDWQVI